MCSFLQSVTYINKTRDQYSLFQVEYSIQIENAIEELHHYRFGYSINYFEVYEEKLYTKY